MLGRCQYPGNKDYHRYGGGGIRVCERWQAFENFLADMGERPSGHTLDRIDNAGNYEPGNCRWATIVEQRQNQRGMRVRFIEFRGERLCLLDWARKLGLPQATLWERLRNGWPLEQALSNERRSYRQGAE